MKIEVQLRSTSTVRWHAACIITHGGKLGAITNALSSLDEPIAAANGFKLPRVCTPEELMGGSAYE